MTYKEKVFEVAKSIFVAKHAYFEYNYSSNKSREIFDKAKKFVDDWNNYEKTTLNLNIYDTERS